MAASDLSEWRAGVLLTGKLLGDRFGDPSVARYTAGAAQTRPIDGSPNIGIEAKALAPSVVQLRACVIRGHGPEAGAEVAPKSRTNVKRAQRGAGQLPKSYSPRSALG
jgi:hypothetical protein